MIVKAAMINAYGDADVLEIENVTVQDPQAGEILIQQNAIGVNFHDIYVRSGMYDKLVPPGVLGCEAAGVVLAIGSEVGDFKPGDRVAYVTGPPYGAYASHRILPAKSAVHLPDDISDELTAGNLLRALTVDMLTRQVAKIQPGMTVLVHAAAGGVGRLLCQMATSMGAVVIGTVGTPEKAAVAESMGCHHPVLYRDVDFAAQTHRLTKGRGVDIVYDSIGADTFEKSLDVLALRGHLVNFGQSSGNVTPLPMARLAAKSLTVTRPILFHYLTDTGVYRDMAATVFSAFGSGVLRADAPNSFTLAQASKAHEFLASRAAVSPVILVP